MKIKKQFKLQAIQQQMANTKCINKTTLQAIKGGNDFVVIDEIDGL